MTSNPEKVKKLWSESAQRIKIIGKQLTREYRINWELVNTQEYEGSRFVFTLDDLGEKATTTSTLKQWLLISYFSPLSLDD